VKVITYNINGIRSALDKGLIPWLKATNADLVCFQEVKALPEQISLLPFEELGYQLYWHPALKKGYSGVATLSRFVPLQTVTGCGIEKYDQEGRLLRLDFPGFSLLNVYMPSGSSGEVRQGFKMQWLADFSLYIKNLQKTHANLIICGDYNICHQAIDIHNPKANARSSGFLPEERTWFTDFLQSGFTDTFRYLNAEPHQYTWWSYRAGARKKNLGWRIDYLLVNDDLAPFVKRAVILKEVDFSDHCPVLVELNIPINRQ
jgi:exodeoxyribonuclease-3